MWQSKNQSWRHHQRVSHQSFGARVVYGTHRMLTGVVAFLDRGESECAPHRRIQVLAAGIFLIAIGVVVRLYSLQEMEFPRWSKIASQQHLSQIKVHGARGTIYDTQGRVLAVSVKTLSVAAHPKKIHEAGKMAKELGSIIPVSEKEILNKLNSGKKFVWLAHGVPMETEPALRDYLTSGVSSVEDFSRIYPQGSVGGPILGRVGRDGSGQSGVERQFDALLAAADMNINVRRDARGRLMNSVNFIPDAEAAESGDLMRADSDKQVRTEGRSLTVSIDALIQGIVEEEVRNGAHLAKARRAFGLVMDAETGEILALAQSDEFNPNGAEGVQPDALHNAILQDAFEPGSTIKPLVAAVALDKKLVRTEEKMNCESGGRYQVGKHVVRDVHPVGEVMFPEVLVRSSNICMAKIGQRMGKAALSDALDRYGFGSTTGLELPGESKGILRPVDRWAEIDVATHAFGQGISVTALQLVQAYTALANDGLMVQPTLLKRDPRAAIPRARLFSAETAQKIAEILHGVTESEHGTGLKAAISGIHVSGKTGTAQKARDKGRGYDPNKIFASFIGFVNAREMGINRKLVMFVAVDEPGVYPRWGGALAGPIFRQSMERILAHLMTSPAEA